MENLGGSEIVRRIMSKINIRLRQIPLISPILRRHSLWTVLRGLVLSFQDAAHFCLDYRSNFKFLSCLMVRNKNTALYFWLGIRIVTFRKTLLLYRYRTKILKRSPQGLVVIIFSFLLLRPPRTSEALKKGSNFGFLTLKYA